MYYLKIKRELKGSEKNSLKRSLNIKIMRKLFWLLSVVFIMTLFVEGVYAQKADNSHGATGAVIGAAAGAGVGAVASKRHKTRNAVIGGVVGAGAGYAIGHKKKYPRKRVYRK